MLAFLCLNGGLGGEYERGTHGDFPKRHVVLLLLHVTYVVAFS